MRGKKEHEDNLGEELISICVHILSYLPGVFDGKICVLTDDKGTVGKIDSVMRRTNPHNRGAKIILFSTPKLVQHMFQEHVAISEDEMIKLISQGGFGNIVVMGTIYFRNKWSACENAGAFIMGKNRKEGIQTAGRKPKSASVKR